LTNFSSEVLYVFYFDELTAFTMATIETMIATNKRLAKTIVATLKEFKAEESDDVSVFEIVCLLELSATI
jgi:hypothetical protein